MQCRNIHPSRGANLQEPHDLMKLISCRASVVRLNDGAYEVHHPEQSERPWPRGSDDPWQYGPGCLTQPVPGLAARHISSAYSPVATLFCSCFQRVAGLLCRGELSSDHFVRRGTRVVNRACRLPRKSENDGYFCSWWLLVD